MSWWRHQIEMFSASLALCEWNPKVTIGFLSQSQWCGTLIYFFYLRLNKQWSKQSRRRWFETHDAHYDATVVWWTDPSLKVGHACVIASTLSLFYAIVITYPCPNLISILILLISGPWMLWSWKSYSVTYHGSYQSEIVANGSTIIDGGYANCPPYVTLRIITITLRYVYVRYAKMSVRYLQITHLI